jgi:hypothetical protein
MSQARSPLPARRENVREVVVSLETLLNDAPRPPVAVLSTPPAASRVTDAQTESTPVLRSDDGVQRTPVADSAAVRSPVLSPPSFQALVSSVQQTPRSAAEALWARRVAETLSPGHTPGGDQLRRHSPAELLSARLEARQLLAAADDRERRT